MNEAIRNAALFCGRFVPLIQKRMPLSRQR